MGGSSEHKPVEVSEFLAATEGRRQLFYLPYYPLPLNPDEGVWKNVNHDRVASSLPQTVVSWSY